MKKITLIFGMMLLASILSAQSKEEKINISYWYVFGRFPSTAEMSYWKGQADQSISWYITNHHGFLKADDASNTQVVTQSYKDAFGRQPNSGEMNFWKGQKRTYADLMNEHVKYLVLDPNENRSTINRAYQAVYSRTASSGEMVNWEKGNLSYLMLTACLRSYKSSYRLQSVEGVMNFVKGAWETTTNFVVNTGSAIYNAAAGAVSATIAAGQRILTLGASPQVANDIQRVDPKVFAKLENGQWVMTGGAGSMNGIGQLINLDGATLISDRGAGVVGTNGGTFKSAVTLIAAGGLN